MKKNDLINSITSMEFGQKILDRIRATKINVLLLGGTGTGKSSTISALFQDYGDGSENKAKIGHTSKPETMDITAYELRNLIIWDTPGLGDSTEKDKEHQRKIIELLRKNDKHGQPLIDLVFLLLDASSRDFTSAHNLINNVVLPNLQGDDRKRLLIGINKADKEMSHYHWDEKENKPKSKLIEKLDEKVLIIKDRIKEEAGLDVDPIYFSAGLIENDEVIRKPYNLQKLMSFIMERLPEKKRASIAEHINQNKENFQSNDDEENYTEKVDKSITDSIASYLSELIAEVKKFATDPKIIDAAGKLIATTAISLFKIISKK